MADTISKLDASIGGVFNGVGDVIIYDTLSDASLANAKLSGLSNGKSLGDLYDGTVSYTGDEPTMTDIKNEQGQVIYSFAEDGTFSFEGTIASLNPAVTQKFLKGTLIADASAGAATWLAAGATTVGFGEQTATFYAPITWLNREKNKAITFPKALIVATLSNQDDGIGIKFSAKAQKVDTATLKTVMLSTLVTPNYAA